MPRHLHSSVKAKPPYNISSFSPPGASVVSNMAFARMHAGHGSPSALTYHWFYTMVRNHGKWDYKYHYGSEYANFGNFNFGAVGTAIGIPEEILPRAAGWAQGRAGTRKKDFGAWYSAPPYGDDPVDQAWIRTGIDYAKRSGY